MSKKLFDVQPQWCRKPLDVSLVNNFESLSNHMKRLVTFDPSDAYDRLNAANAIDPFERYNSVSVSLLFPKKDGFCACGCGKKLTGRQRVWAGNDCQNFALNVQCIISGHSHLLTLCEIIFGKNCSVCGKPEDGIVNELDHKYPVKFGGSGGWLTNYEFKCKKCHREKTNADFGWKQGANTNQFKIEFEEWLNKQ